MITLNNRPVYRYWRDCTSFRQAEVPMLQEMIDRAIEITWKTFRQHVSTEDLETLFPDYHWRQGPCPKTDWGLRLKDDYAVSFHRSRYNGQAVYYVRHSSIEYIFTREGR